MGKTDDALSIVWLAPRSSAPKGAAAAGGVMCTIEGDTDECKDIVADHPYKLRREPLRTP